MDDKYKKEKKILIGIIIFLAALVLIFVIGTLKKNNLNVLVLEESSLGFIPRTLNNKTVTGDDELASFIQVYIFKRYTFTPESAENQISDSFKLSSKRVQDAITKDIEKNSLIEKIKTSNISQSFHQDSIKYAKEGKDLIVTASGERIISKDTEIQSRRYIKLTFHVKKKFRDKVNPYQFYIAGIHEEIVR
jgi:hypothetical protein